MTVLGIDIGVQGAIAIMGDSGSLLEIHEMPCLHSGPAGRRVVNAPLLASIIFNSHADRAFVEWVSSRPTDGHMQAFCFGHCKGVIEGVLAAAGIPCTFITPASWKRAVGLAPGRDKDASRAEAIRRWPAQADFFKLKKDDGLAEAALIAVAGMMRVEVRV